MKTALITGITGQDGSYLAELLLEKGYTVYGLMRRSSNFSTTRIDHILDRLTLLYGDLTDGASLSAVLNRVEPDEVYNLAGQSHVRVSFDQPVYTSDVNALGTLRLLEAIRAMRGKRPRFYQASSSEMFGTAPAPHFDKAIFADAQYESSATYRQQDENTPFEPHSPYGAAKLAAHWNTVNYRKGYGLFACCGILFNHESPRRGETFVTRKITRAVTRIKCGLQDKLYLGNLDAKRDWGFAGDYVRAMWLMLQADEPDDYVVATGDTSRVADFLKAACDLAGIEACDCVGYDVRYERPNEIDVLCGNAEKARRVLGWEPTVDLRGLVVMMVESDMRLAEGEVLVRDAR